MGFISFIKGLLKPSPGQPGSTAAQDERERCVLLVLAISGHNKSGEALSLSLIAKELNYYNWQMPTKDLVVTVRTLVQKGYVQRLDGGNKDKTEMEVSYVISGEGLNKIGLPG